MVSIGVLRRACVAALTGLLVFGAGDALAQTATVEVLAPPTLVPGTDYDLRVNYAFGGGTVTNPKVVVDLPPGVLLTTLGGFADFEADCQVQANTSFPSNHDWICEFTATSIDVPSGGVSGQLPLRIQAARWSFEDSASVTFDAVLSGDNFSTSTDSGGSTISATIDLQRSRSISPLGFLRHTTTNEMGVIFRHYERLQNRGTALLAPGLEGEFEMPSDALYIGFNNKAQSYTINNTIWGTANPISVTNTGTTGLLQVNRVSNSPNGFRATSFESTLWTDTYQWIPCSIAPLASANYDVAYTGTSNADGSGVAYLDPTTYSYNPVNSFGLGYNCSDEIALSSAQSGNFVPGTARTIGYRVGAPHGAVPLHDLYLVQTLPAGLEYTRPYVSVSWARDQSVYDRFDHYICDLPALADMTFTLADFLSTHKDSGNCQLVPRFDSGDFTGSTHFVAYSEEFYSEESYGDAVMHDIYGYITGKAPGCQATGAGFTTHAYTSAQTSETGGFSEASRSQTFGLDVADFMYNNGHNHYAPNNSNTVNGFPGDTNRLDLNWNSNRADNPTMTVELPEGIIITDLQWRNYNGACDIPSLQWTATPNATGGTTISIVTEPFFLTSGCADHACQPAGYGFPQLYYFIDPSKEWLDGETIQFSNTVDSDNNRYTAPQTRTSTIRINVPANEVLRIEPTCSGSPGDGNRDVGVLGRMMNRGGLPLTDVTVVIPIPKVGDGSGTEVNTTYNSHVADTGVVVTCSNDNQMTWGACTASATHVRASAPEVSPYQQAIVEIFLTVPAGTSAGAKIFATGSLESVELLPVSGASVAPSLVDICPGQLAVNAWFDDDADANRDNDEQPLQDWSVTLTAADGSEYSYDIEPDGTISQNLPAGTYMFTVNPPPGMSTWSYTTPIPATITINADQTTTVNIPATCTCGDDNFCTEDSCNFLGECIFTARPAFDGVPDAVCDGIDNDCDGSIDEDYVSVSTSCGQGVCERNGSSTCVNGTEDDGCNPGQPSAGGEQCNGLDDDCDGLTDAQDDDFVVPNCANQAGVCQGATHDPSQCVQSGDSWIWQPCTSSTYAAAAFPELYQPMSEAGDGQCDGADNDCDGSVDEHYPNPAPATTCGQGSCAAEGQLVCINGGTVDTCSDGLGGIEICNGLDDDCDGLTDAADPDLADNLPTCENQNGVCFQSLKPAYLCVAGIWAACGPAEYTAYTTLYDGNDPDTCDALDTDCDGSVDEDFVGTETTCGFGVCETTVTSTCSNGSVNDGCTPDDSQQSVEFCDGVDNDCDGNIDEDFTLGGACSVGVGLCAASGVTVCSDNGQTTTCDAVPAPSTVEICDGLDNDCDGGVDEDFGVGEACQVGQGECLASGTLVCSGDQNGTVCDAQPGLPSEELCDGLDNDCDDSVDEDFDLGTTCTVGVGACVSQPSTIICLQDGTAACDAVAGTPSPETCDNVDNNCDGMVDNDPETEGTICEPVDTAILSCPPTITGTPDGVFCFVDPDDATNGNFECSIDGADWVDCSGTVGASQSCAGVEFVAAEPFGVGSHTFQVRAVGDLPSIVDPTPANCSWVYDDTVPDTSFAITPDDPSQSSDASFVFDATQDDVTYYCVLDPDGGVFPDANDLPPCDEVTDFSGLDDGEHTICVAAENTAGNRDQSPACFTWTIDTTLPETAAECVAAVLSDTSASFSFDDPGDATTDSFECRCDDGAWMACTSPATCDGLADGTHSFSVRAIDGSGNIDPTPAQCQWVVDTDPPDTSIATCPESPWQSTDAIVGFGSDEDGVSYLCAITAGGDAAPTGDDYAACGATMTFSDLSDGAWTVWVVAVDAAGNSDASAAQCDFSVDTTFPDTVIDVGPPSLISDSDGADFEYSDPTEPTRTTYECRIDEGPWGPCDNGSTGYAADDLDLGSHTFDVRACDTTANQCDPTPARHVFEVVESPCPLDLTPPELTCAGAQTYECVAGTADVDVESFGTSAIESCELSLTWVAASDFGPGTTPVVYTATDGNGNISSCITNVVIEDTQAPSISCPADVTVNTPEDQCGATLDLGAPTVSDTCDSEAALVWFSDAPPTFGTGTTTVNYTVIDRAQQTASCQVTVTVIDDVALSLSCDPLVEVDAPADACGWDGAVTATAVDNCAVDATILEEANFYQVGSSDVLFTASDDSDNTAECTTQLLVNDVTAPTLECGHGVGDLPLTSTPIAGDACDAVVTIDGVVCELLDDNGDVAETLALEDCPVTVVDGSLTVSEAIEGQALRVRYDAEAVDPSNNATALSCVIDVPGSPNDIDDDGIPDDSDNCPSVANAEQVDTDGDGVGDNCDGCPNHLDPGQEDADGDGVGDACEEGDGDGVIDSEDNCPGVANAEQLDADGDGLGDSCDICPNHADPEQLDVDGNGQGDACEDQDMDGVLDEVDNCLETPNTDQTDADGDGLGDACDNCPSVANVDQADGDSNGTGDACQDSDDDGVIDILDNCADVFNGDQLDFDGDGVGNTCDPADEGVVAFGGADNLLGCGGGSSLPVGWMLAVLALVAMAWRRRVA